MVQIPKNPRKLKRFLENEAYAKDARYWKGRVRTADRLDIVSSPVNRQALNQTNRRRPRQRRAKRPTLVYVVAFVLRADPSIKFLKIGITTHDVPGRFAADSEIYHFAVVHQISAESTQHALAMERSLHELFRTHRFRPPMPLRSGGNSECFAYSDALEARMADLISSWLSSVGRAAHS
jgi:hypothetical protein